MITETGRQMSWNEHVKKQYVYELKRRYKNVKNIDDESVGRPTAWIMSRHVMENHAESSVAT